MEVGDRVKIVRTIYMSDELQVGKEGVILSLSDGIADVRMDEDQHYDWPFEESELEVI